VLTLLRTAKITTYDYDHCMLLRLLRTAETAYSANVTAYD